MAYPFQQGLPQPAAYPQPVALPPGYGMLVVSANRGPYLVPVLGAGQLKVDRQKVPLPGNEGTWFVPVPAGPHDVRVTDFMGLPIVTTDVMVHPGAGHPLTFRFGGWRNRVADAQGTDVTKFGLWSNYLILLVTMGVMSVGCCVPVFVAALGS